MRFAQRAPERALSEAHDAILVAVSRSQGQDGWSTASEIAAARDGHPRAHSSVGRKLWELRMEGLLVSHDVRRGGLWRVGWALTELGDNAAAWLAQRAPERRYPKDARVAGLLPEEPR